MTHLVTTKRNGEQLFYTGRAGDGWLSANKAEAFAYTAEGAGNKARMFNTNTPLHGLTFEAAAN